MAGSPRNEAAIRYKIDSCYRPVGGGFKHFFSHKPVHVSSGATLTPVIELYTSEGCSLCPPADKWASSLIRPVPHNAVMDLKTGIT